jgi:hypothetical protein
MKAVPALFVGKNSRSNAHFGVLLCGAGYQRKSAPERPPVRAVTFSRANERPRMVKHWCCAQWIARVDDFWAFSRAQMGSFQRFTGGSRTLRPENYGSGVGTSLEYPRSRSS